MHSHSIIPRALYKRATQNINMAVEPEEGGKLAHGRQQSILPVRAKTRRQTTTYDGTPEYFCLSSPDRRQTAIFPLENHLLMTRNHEAIHKRARITIVRMNPPRKLLELVKSLHCADRHSFRIGDERRQLVTASPVMTKSWGPSWGKKLPG
jgi:hypothetical protein